MNGGVILFRLDRLLEPPTLRRFWTDVEGVVKEGGYASARLGNFSRGLVYSDQDIENILGYDHPEVRACARV
jgi:hypothetical protein